IGSISIVRQEGKIRIHAKRACAEPGCDLGEKMFDDSPTSLAQFYSLEPSGYSLIISKTRIPSELFVQSKLTSGSQPVEKVNRLISVEARKAAIRLSVFDGARQPLKAGTSMLINLRDGNQASVFNQPVANSTLLIQGLPVQDNLADNYTVIVSAKSYVQAGF